MQRVCSAPCALVHVRAVAAKYQARAAAHQRKQDRAKLAAMQTKPQLTAKAQAAFNAFVRARDASKPCISCGKPLGTEPNTYDCGHYRSIGSAPHMRFVEHNAHGQCKHCNRHLSGNHVAYRQGLVARIGALAVELMEADTTTRKHTHDELVELARQYREQARRMRGVVVDPQEAAA